jgi:hypothetical protein
MRREVVEHHADPFGVRVVLVHEVPHARREIDACALVGDLGVTPGPVHVGMNTLAVPLRTYS